jgi:hypothetical protein
LKHLNSENDGFFLSIIASQERSMGRLSISAEI